MDRSLAFNSNGSMKFVSLNKRPWRARATFVDINSNQTLIYHFTVRVIRCGGSVDDPYVWVCVLNRVKHLNAKVFYLISEVIETIILVQYNMCDSKCGLN